MQHPVEQDFPFWLQVGYTVQLRLSQAYQEFSRDLLESCQLPPELASLPVAFEEPVYGSNEPTFTEFMAPGVILSITYFMAVGLTSLSFIIERKEGLLDRSWVAGVTATEVMLAHVVAQFVVMVVQVRSFSMLSMVHERLEGTRNGTYVQQYDNYTHCIQPGTIFSEF